MYHKFTPLDRPFLRALLLTIKSMSTKHKKEKSKSFYFNTTVPSWSLTPEGASPRSTEDQEPEPDTRNPIDDLYIN